MKYVIFAPHVDDEFIGCYSILKTEDVEHVFYMFETSRERKFDAKLASDYFEFRPHFLDTSSVDVLNRYIKDHHVLLVPNIADHHIHHKQVNQFVRKAFPLHKKLYYSVDMNLPNKVVLSEQDQADKRNLSTLYPSQREYFEQNAQYYLFEHIVESDLRTSIWITTQFEGIHCYPNAPAGVEFLQHPHRHMFHVRVDIDVFHDDREIEFILFKREIESILKTGNMNYKSCEMMATEILDYCIGKYQGRNCKVTVSEDLENGATVEYRWS